MMHLVLQQQKQANHLKPGLLADPGRPEASPATAARFMRMAAVSLSDGSDVFLRCPGRPCLGLPTWLRFRTPAQQSQDQGV